MTIFKIGRTPLLKLLLGWVWIFLFYQMNYHIVNGQTITPFQFVIEEELVPLGGDNPDFNNNEPGFALPILRSFLEPCDILTLETASCSEEEYENNDDCLPQKTDNCDHSKELFCLSGVCLPNCHPHKEMYDHVEGKCFRKVGSDCRIQNTSTPTTSTVVVPPCERNADCERGQCRCAKGFSYDHNFNKCVLYAGYNQHCNDSMSCDTKSDISCRENQCQCKAPTTQYFHLKRKRCYVLIGEVCSNGLQFCPDSSVCLKRSKMNKGKEEQISSSAEKGGHPRLQQLYQDQFDEDDDAEGGEEYFIGILNEEDAEEGKEFVCKCRKGYGVTKDKRFCLGLHGSRCNTLHRCNTDRGLKCYDGSCICSKENEKEQVYSELFQTCITVPGASCTNYYDNETIGNGDICAVGATCKEGKCICDGNLTALSAGHACVKSHGTRCQFWEENDNPFEPGCNYEIDLECNKNEGRCLCQGADQFYDVSQGKCRTFEEIKGKIPVIHFTPPDDREYKFRSGRNGAGARITFPINFGLFIVITIMPTIIRCLPLP